MNKKVLIISFSFEQEEEAFRVLEDAGLEPVLLAEKDRIGYTQEDLLDYWDTLEKKPAGILMGADIPLGKEFAEKAEGLEAISLNCAGADHLDLPAFEKKGIRICNVPRQNFNAVADLVWGLILAVMRRIPEADRNIRRGKWCDGVARGYAVSGKTLGIISFGAIGQAVAKRAAGFDMRVLVNSTSQNPESAEKYGAVYVDRDTLFQEADILVPASPLTPETYHIINADAIGRMKKDAVIVNAARGGIIDTQALYEALKNRRIAGAALDVFEEEPLYESAFFQLDNVVLTPHIGGLADREIHNVAMQAACHMAELLK
ncbi:hypothetical protein GCM10008910_26060 [Faecalicatena orotica]|uniref:D-3-phosphoglycerate dehydrogenase n=1 Tax=Faecalicatena orotica TaxID=1544 RepID=A0A2Y9BI82_9FIRM|nr:phosphoglycerate dehydrogenase [Faecalicatena orotica]PWJ28153.1 D-3-phosphoglycerate dehydrogenase [Faecalicatena orotica]SSA56606.1 D-3-phosphoglycerate dehydrogenase [Faecalicatena orotica]